MTNRQKDKQKKDKITNRQKDKQKKDRRTNRQNDKQTGGQPDRSTNTVV